MEDRPQDRTTVRLAMAIIALATATILAPLAHAEPNLTGLVSNADATWESNVRWSIEGIQGPEFGAFAEQMPVTGTVSEIQVSLSRTDRPGLTHFVLEAYVWANAEGMPGPVLSMVTLDYAGEMPAFPLTTTVSIPLLVPRVANPWVGARITPNADDAAVAIAADLDGGAHVSPMTNIAPGLGFPEGWQPVGVAFEPARSLGIAAMMSDITFEGNILESAGGSDEEVVARSGCWDFERFAEGEFDAPGCAYDWPDTVGSIVDFDGWIAAGPNHGAGVGPFFDENGTIATGTESDVEGQVLWFYDPDVLGFPPHHLTTYELPIIDDQRFELSSGFSALRFLADTEAGAPPETGMLRWVVGSSVMRADGTWGPWLDLTFPVSVGQSAHLVPVLAQGSVRRIRIGMSNPTDILIQSKGKGADKVKEVKKTFGPQTGYKPVPVVNQKKAEVTCQSAAAAQCLAYWAANGYPEILPEGDTLKEKQNKLAKELAKKIEKSTKEGDEKEGKGWGGIASFLKGKGIYKPQVPPGGPPPRRSLESHDVPVDKGSPYDSIKTHLSRSHDVMLGFKAYKDVNGVQTEVLNEQGHPIAHAVTAAQVVEENGKKTIRVADPNGDAAPEVPDIEKAGKTYKDLEVTETGPPVKMKSKTISWPGVEYFCLTSIQIVRPDPPNPEGSRPPERVFVQDLHLRSGGDSLITYGYAILNDRPSPMQYFVLQIEVPYSDVEAPAGWEWAPLPSIPPDYETCENALGQNGNGIAWWTETNPVRPGRSLSGFRFKAHERYPSDPEALDWYLATEENGGEYGFVAGPMQTDDPTHAPDHAEIPILDDPLQVAAWPNPTRGEVEIRFATPVAGDATISFYDPNGRRVRTEWLRRIEAGTSSFEWNRQDQAGRALPSGVYLYRIEMNGRSGDGRIVLLE